MVLNPADFQQLPLYVVNDSRDVVVGLSANGFGEHWFAILGAKHDVIGETRV